MIINSIRTKAFIFSAVLLLLVCGCASERGTSAEQPEKGNSGSEQTRIAPIYIKPVKHKRDRTSRPGHSGASMTSQANTPTSSALRVSGRVSYESGVPVTSATVELYGKPRDTFPVPTVLGSALTDSRGYYSIHSRDAQHLELQVKGPVPDVSQRLAGNPQADTSEPLHRRIHKDVIVHQPASITGRVIDAAGQPVAGLPIQVYPVLKGLNVDNRAPRAHTTTTTAAGEFAFDKLSAGQWDIGTKSPGYAPAIVRFDLPTSVPIVLQLSSRGATVKGEVLLHTTRQPVGNMEVELRPASVNRLPEIDSMKAYTAGDGTFQFDNVSTSSRFLSVYANHELGLAMTPPRLEKFTLNEGETTHITVLVYPGHSVAGTVYDKDTSDPLSGAVVTCTAGQSSSGDRHDARVTTSAADGSYRLDNIISDGLRFSVDVSLENFMLAAGTAVNVDPAMEQLVVTRDLAMVPTVTISGRVITSDGLPIPRARIHYLSSRFTGEDKVLFPVAADGTFKIEAAPFSQGYIIARADGFGEAQSNLIDVANQSIKGVTVTMELGATLQGIVLLPDGRPAPAAKVTANRPVRVGTMHYVEEQDQQLTDLDGRFTMRDLPSKVMISASKSGYADAKDLALDLKPGEVRNDLEIHLNSPLTISGRVVTSTGEPVRAMLFFRGEKETGIPNGWSATSGEFESVALAEGTYSIDAYCEGRSVTVDGIKAGTTNVEIVLKDHKVITLIGTVIEDATGEPISDFTITGEGRNANIKRLREPGKFQYSGLKSHTIYSITIATPRYKTKTFQVLIDKHVDTLEKTFPMGNGGAITGRVIDSQSRKPVADVSVVNWGDTLRWQRSSQTPLNQTVTDAEGRFTLAPASPGDIEVLFRPAAPLAQLSRVVQVTNEQTVDMGDIELTGGGTIRGQVLRQGAPVPDIAVELSARVNETNFFYAATTDPDGRFVFNNLAAADYQVKAVPVTTTHKVNLLPGATADVIFQLGGITLRGSISRNEKPAGESISLQNSSGQAYATFGNGTFEIQGLLPGTYVLTAGSYKETIEVPDQPVVIKDIILPSVSVPKN